MHSRASLPGSVGPCLIEVIGNTELGIVVAEASVHGGDLRPHSILDPIHGLIRFTDEEFAIINHALFQRLRRIKQNGLLYLVFPSATHNRFEHSLGALRVADAMIEQIYLNSIVARQKGAISSNDLTGSSAIDFSAVPEELQRWIIRIARLAALVHDLGHGPLSHAFDSFAPMRSLVRSLLDQGAVPAIQGLADALTEWERPPIPGSPGYERTPHEVMSCLFFARAYSDLIEGGRLGRVVASGFEALAIRREAQQTILAVIAAVLGLGPNIAAVASSEHREWLPFIHDLIASAPADADRMDYLERDSRALGVTYGLFDRNRVLKSFLVFREISSEGPRYRLGVKKSGIQALENLVQARFQLYVQIYLHKTNNAVSMMLKEIGRLALENHYDLFHVEAGQTNSLDELVKRYLSLGDDAFLELLETSDEVPAAVRQLAGRIASRRIWKRIYEGKEYAGVADRLKAEASDEDVKRGILPDVSKPKATKDLDKGATLLERGDDGIYAPAQRTRWYESSILIQALRQAEGNIGRVYAAGAALDRLDTLKDRARRIGHELEAASTAESAPQEG